MNRTYLRVFPLAFLLALVGATSVGCVNAENEVVLPPTASRAVPTDDVGLTSGCDDSAPPVGRLRGLVYTLPPETRLLPDFDALRPSGAICMNSLAVTERRSFPGVRNRAEWFGVDFKGVALVTEPGTFRFRLTSDDGSKLYVDNTLVIDNDGYHVTRSAEGAVYLSAGAHTISVPYWQGPGPLSLILEVAAPSTEAYEVFQVDRPLETSAS